MRVGPSRLTSTAPSMGASKLTVAAEWMTMSQLAQIARSLSSSPRPSVLTSPPAFDVGPESVLAELVDQAMERVVAEHLPPSSFGRRRPFSGPDQQHEFAVGH